jgi:hypothetical protein
MVVLAVAMLAAVELPRRPEERFATDEWALLQEGERYARVQLTEISAAGATLRGRARAALGAPVSLVVEGMGGVKAQVARAAKKESEVSFDLSPAQRDALLLKLFSGRYGAGPEKTVFSDVLTVVALRVVR